MGNSVKRSPWMVIIALVFSIGGFVLAMVSMFAGSHPGRMEEYHVIAINMSNFGHDLVPTATSGGSNPTSTSEGGIGAIFSSVVASAESAIGDALDDIADELSTELGISQWYSLHIMNACEGTYAPNATSPGAWYNVTNCTAQEAGYQFNLTEVLDHELQVGPLKLNLNQLGFPEDIQDFIDYLNSFLLAIFVFYVLGSALAGLSFLLCIVELTLRNQSTLIRISGIITAGLSALTLGVGSAITTAVAKKGESEINEKGDDVGISANAGGKFMIISWVSFGAMFVAFIVWLLSFCMGRKKTRGASHSSGLEKGETRQRSSRNRFSGWRRTRRSHKAGSF
ncbi:actin cortical patch SUR7/pH-response regulator pali [Pseudomassariella vexata]|uniref:Actin cortical patch SUR7/pH-response regulator pali n=1 Tax=Pseudomassariella vexata TaxID=1141098 RepID=A0A1Y2DUV1_9PEZI|nr:actin cortical patch SUR7/pH-response regulator pali [Pseudomassariella vexata]ORY63062.1 actin cortical patch SUR7/pH-response regulator pali [Pseudomassariella vexata]